MGTITGMISNDGDACSVEGGDDGETHIPDMSVIVLLPSQETA